MSKTLVILPAHIVKLASDYLVEHANLLDKQGFDASARMVRGVVGQIQEQVKLQTPQTLEEQIKTLTNIFGCGPDPDFNR